MAIITFSGSFAQSLSFLCSKIEGVRELWWDPGNVISQNIVHFNTAGLSKLILIAPQEQYRGLPDSSYRRSFADAIYWSTDVS